MTFSCANRKWIIHYIVSINDTTKFCDTVQTFFSKSFEVGYSFFFSLNDFILCGEFAF